MTRKTGTVPQWPSHEWPTPPGYEGRYGPKPNTELPPLKAKRRKKRKKTNKSKLTIATIA